jgi:hypothetical protein
MRAFFAVLLSVIAVGVVLVAYGLLKPRVAVAESYQPGRPMLVSDRVSTEFTTGEDATAMTPQLQLRCEPGQRAIIRQLGGAAAAECVDGGYASAQTALARPVSDVRPVQTYASNRIPRRTTTARVGRGRDWTKTAMVIGGSGAAGAGLGALFGGKKGALIGAAIGGGAGTLYEVRKK